MKFVLGIAIGAIGAWAYQNGKLNSLMGMTPEPLRNTWQGKVDQARAPEIVTPTPAEVAGRPSEPLPTPGA